MLTKIILILLLNASLGEASYFTSVKKLNELVEIDWKLFKTVFYLSSKSKDDNLKR